MKLQASLVEFSINLLINSCWFVFVLTIPALYLVAICSITSVAVNGTTIWLVSFNLTEIIESLLTLVQQTINELNITQTEEIVEP